MAAGEEQTGQPSAATLRAVAAATWTLQNIFHHEAQNDCDKRQMRRLICICLVMYAGFRRLIILFAELWVALDCSWAGHPKSRSSFAGGYESVLTH